MSDPNDKPFIWKIIIKKYKKRSDDLEEPNLYKWVVYHWKEGKLIVPQFFGYHDTVVWPLEETYAKWNLTLFKPWRDSIVDSKSDDGSGKILFANTLKD